MQDTVYQVITDRVMALLEKGVVPWQKPWASAQAMPRNLVSRKPYRGVNVFLLHAMSYESPFWLTFKQAQELGGHVRKGEKSCPVVFWKWLDVASEESGQQGDKAKRERIPLLRYYSVFNVRNAMGSRRQPLTAKSASTIRLSLPSRLWLPCLSGQPSSTAGHALATGQALTAWICRKLKASARHRIITRCCSMNSRTARATRAG